jgi:hypothetical protein
MSKGTIEAVCLTIKIDGQLYNVKLPQDRLKLLVKMAEGLSDGGKLPVRALSPEYKLVEYGEAMS